MNKEFVTYDIALSMKELGFDEPCMAWYNYNGEVLFKFKKPHTDDINLTNAPLYQQAFRWFKKKYGLCSWIERMYTADSICYYRYTCEYKKDPSSKTHEVIVSIKEYNTYEEAELACLKKLIEILNQNKDE